MLDENNTEYTTGTEYSADGRDVCSSDTTDTHKVKKSHKGLKITALALGCIILGGAAGIGGMKLIDARSQIPEAAEDAGFSSKIVIAEPRDDNELFKTVSKASDLLSAPEVYEENVNSTVGIKTSITTNYWGYQSTSAAAGSGFIVTDDGYILTNYHVIEDSNSVTVTLFDGKSYEAEIIGGDESNDIAVIKIDAEGLSPVTIGDSDNLLVGETVYAIGNPLGELTFSMTQGIVSALDRSVTFSDGISMKLIQTDCAINSGNSGGALFNAYGEVIGITNAKYSSSSSGASVDNIGFAIPINTVVNIVTDIIDKGYISKPYIGVSVSTVTDEYANYGLPSGASVQEVTKDGPADEAGIKQYDIIIGADGTDIKSTEDLVSFIGKKSPGDEVVFTVYRQGGELEITVEIGEKVQSATEDLEAAKEEESADYSQTFPISPFSFFGW